MKKIIKKVLAMLLVVCIALPTFVMTVSAEEGENTSAQIKWSYDPTTKVLTYTANGAGQITNAGITSAGHSTEIVEVIVKNGTSKFNTIAYGAFQSMSALQKITIPATVTKTSSTQQFNQALALKELVVEGNAYIPGAADFSNIETATFSGTSHRAFENTSIETLILKGGVYSESSPIVVLKSDGITNMLGNAISTIMGPYGDTYLSSVATGNGWNYVPYGKIGEGTAWTYDEATKTVTIYGNGTSSTLTALSDGDAEILQDATKVVIRADITAIEANALAGLNALADVEFLGNAPETTGNPFGEKTGITIYPVPGATGFDDFYGYTVSYPEVKGEFIATKNGTTNDGAWKLDFKTKTLHIWSNNTAKSIYLPNLVGAESFVAFAEGDYSKYVTTVKFSQIDDDTNFVKTITGNNTGLGQFATLGLTEIEKIYFFGSTLQTMTKMFQGLAKLTTFGNATTEEGTVDLDKFIFHAGSSNDAFSGQTGIEKVILPSIRSEGDAWGLAFDYVNRYFTWANIPDNHFAGMTGLKEVVLSDTDTIMNTAGGRAYASGTSMIGANAFDGCVNLKTLTIPASAPASATFRKSTGINEYTVNLFNENTFTGSSIETVYIWNPDAAVVAEYNIPNVANIICANDAVKAAVLEDTTADVSCILTGVGVAVRYEKYNGLRNIYSFNNVANANMGGYTLVEYGVMLVSSNKLGESELTIDPSNLNPTVTGAVKRAIWSNNAWAGKVLSYDENGETQFALTLTNYTDNWDSGVYSRAYAVYEDGNGNSFVAYADNGKAISLYDAMVSGCKQGALKDLICEDVAVWDVLKTGINGNEISVDENTTAMVIDGKTDEDAKVLVVRNADGSVADADDIAVAQEAVTAAGYTVDSEVIALAFKPATEA